MTKEKFVTLIWEDAATYTNDSLEEIFDKKEELVKTYGILTHKCDKYHIILTHDGGEGNSDCIRVPSSLVRKTIRHRH